MYYYFLLKSLLIEFVRLSKHNPLPHKSLFDTVFYFNKDIYTELATQARLRKYIEVWYNEFISHILAYL